MKNLFPPTLKLSLLLAIAFSCSQPQKTVSNSKNTGEATEEKEVNKNERPATTFFPMVIAGSIRIIHVVYFGKKPE